MKLNSTIIYNKVYSIVTVIEIKTDNTSLILGVNKETGVLLQFHYGKSVSSLTDIIPQGNIPKGQEFTAAYSTFGGYDNTGALRVTHEDGSLSTELVYDSHSISDESENVVLTKVVLKDKHYPFYTELNYRAFKREDAIETWVNFHHSEAGAVVLNEYPSIELTLSKTHKDYYLTTFQGLWEREHSLQEEKLSLGKKIIDNRFGTWSSFGHNPSFMISLDDPSTETRGKVIAGALAWSGAWKMSFDYNQGKLHHDTTERRQLSITAGSESFAADYHLEPSQQFKTPKFIMTYSENGRGLASRNIHKWARKFNVRSPELERPILLNSWEGAFFSFDESTILKMMDRTADVGVEMFVLDDGWFGNGKFARNDSTAGLGDWEVNRKKLPRGLSFLANEAKNRGLKFGIWVEPEMVNPQSELFEKHPEWAIQQSNREEILYRSQLLLDMTNPEVQNHAYQSVANIIRSNPGISYVKWDCNRSFTNVGSTHLAKDRQTHIWVDYVNGLYAVYDRLTKEFPETIFQACASGGGRIDYGILKYNHEFWTSDNTDPMQRIYIQWGTSYLYPASAMAAHVSISPNHQTKRVTSIKFRFDVAMSGRLGLELNPDQVSEEEAEFSKKAVALYKQIRPIVQKGNLYRLVSPYEYDYSSLMYVSENSADAVLFAYNTNHRFGNNFYSIKLQGLNPASAYKVEEINKASKNHLNSLNDTYSGQFLMDQGITVDIDEEYDSLIVKISKVS